MLSCKDISHPAADVGHNRLINSFLFGIGRDLPTIMPRLAGTRSTGRRSPNVNPSHPTSPYSEQDDQLAAMWPL